MTSHRHQDSHTVMHQYFPATLVHPVPAVMLQHPLPVMHQYFPASLVHPIPAIMLQHSPAFLVQRMMYPP
jgi:hypothetical protein